MLIKAVFRSPSLKLSQTMMYYERLLYLSCVELNE